MFTLALPKKLVVLRKGQEPVSLMTCMRCDVDVHSPRECFDKYCW